MPADSDLPTLPVRYRPLGVRFAAYLATGMVVVVSLAIWIAFPPEIRAKFTAFQLSTVFVLFAGAVTCGYALTRSRVDARAEGVTVVNGFKRRDLEWSQILAVSLRPGSPWVVLDLSDGTAIAAMGIQASDGGRARRQVRTLRRLVEARSATPRDD